MPTRTKKIMKEAPKKKTARIADAKKASSKIVILDFGSQYTQGLLVECVSARLFGDITSHDQGE